MNIASNNCIHYACEFLTLITWIKKLMFHYKLLVSFSYETQGPHYTARVYTQMTDQILYCILSSISLDAAQCPIHYSFFNISHYHVLFYHVLFYHVLFSHVNVLFYHVLF